MNHQQAYTSANLKYLLYIPDDFQPNHSEKWPLVLFLHGSGERGDDPEKIKKYCLPRELERKSDFPFLVLSPLCPANTRWTDLAEAVMELLKEIVARYDVDTACVYLTGFSMGGEGAWYLGVKYPDRFAAVVPVSGAIPDQEGFLDELVALKDTPVWVFHSTADEFVPFKNSEMMVQKLRQLGGNVRFTVYDGFRHGQTSDATYANETIYNWFLTHGAVS